MSKTLPNISIVILNWNSYTDTLALLKSIKKSDYPQKKIEIIIVDNGSEDNSLAILKNAFTKIKAISLSSNEGVSARNYGFKIATGKIIFSIDSDVVVSRDFLKIAAGKLQQDSQIGALGGKIIDKKTGQAEPSAHSFNLFTGTIKPLKEPTDSSHIAFLKGAALVYPQKVFRKIGYYDRDFFFYGEELDFCLRILKAGLKLHFSPECLVRHGKLKLPKENYSIYKHYYKALFKIIFEYGNLAQKTTAPLFQLTLIPILNTLRGKKSLISSRGWGFWWNSRKLISQNRLVLAIIGVGLILRLLAIDLRDFWFDEAFTYHIARLPLKDLVVATASDNNPPLYYLAIHSILTISNEQVWLRFPSLSAGMITIVAAYNVLKEKIGRENSLFAAALIATSPLAIYISTEARLHSLGTLILVLITGQFFKTLNKTNFKNLILLILLISLGFFTHYYILLLYFPFTLIIYLNKKKAIKKWFFILMTPLILVVPWLLISAKSTHNGCSCPNTVLSLPSSLISPLVGGVGEITLRFFPKLGIAPLIFLGLISTVGLLLFIRGLPKNVISLYYLLPLLLLSIVGFFLPVFSPKAFAIFSPFYFATIALGIINFESKFATRFIFVGIFILISLFETYNHFFKGANIKPIIGAIENYENIPVYHTSVYTYYSTNYYLEEKKQNYLLTENPLSHKTVEYITGQKTAPDLGKSFLLVDTTKWVNEREYSAVMQNIANKFTQEYEYNLDQVRVLVMKPR